MTILAIYGDSEKFGNSCEYGDLHEYGDAGESCDSIKSCFFLVILVIFSCPSSSIPTLVEDNLHILDITSKSFR